MKIMMTAEAFNLGPICKLVSILGYLKEKTDRKIKYIFFGEKNLYEFAKINGGFDYYYQASRYNMIKILKRTRPSLIISVMDPWSVLYGYYLKIPSITFDSLFWKWKIDGLEKYELFLGKLSQMSIAEITNYFSKLNIYDQHVLATILSKRVYVQNFPTIETNIKKIRSLYNKIMKCNLVDLRFVSIVEEKSNECIISYGGLRSPHYNAERAKIYNQLIGKLFQRPIYENSTVKFTQVSFGRKIKLANTQSTVFTHRKFLEKLNKTNILFSPPGLTTILEAFFYRVPLILLPEKHSAQKVTYEIIKHHGLELPHIFFSEDQRKESIKNTEELYESYKKIIQIPLEIERKSRYLSELITWYMDEKSAKKLVDKQFKFVAKDRCPNLGDVIDHLLSAETGIL
jgi:hypothetical protein